MKWLNTIGVLIVPFMLSGCLSSGGGSSSTSRTVTDAAEFETGAFKGLALSEAGTPAWVTILSTGDGLLLGNLRDANDRLLGGFKIDMQEEQGFWYPLGEVSEQVTLATSSFEGGQWQAELLIGNSLEAWTLDLSQIPVMAGSLESSYRLMIGAELWMLELKDDEQFTLASASCQETGSWGAVAEGDNSFIQLEFEAGGSACSSLAGYDEVLAHVDDQFQQQGGLLQLILGGSSGVISSYGFGGTVEALGGYFE